MDFIYKIQAGDIPNFNLKYVDKLSSVAPKTGTVYIEKLPHLDYKEISGDKRVFLMGDVIRYDADDQIADKGHFYQISWDSERKNLEFSNDLHGFLPIYYAEQDGNVLISSSVDYLYSQIKELITNQDFYHQNVLFNFPFQDTCFFYGVKRLCYGQRILVNSEGLKIIQSKRFFEYYVESPTSYRKALPEIVDLFIKKGAAYFDQPACLAFTSGFDSRTNLALAYHYKNDFITYAYGKPDFRDVAIPAQIAKNLGFPFIMLDLGNDYIKHDHENFTIDYLKHSGGMNGFLQSHVAYGANRFKDENRPIIVGYVGSELLRSTHFAGALNSSVIIDLVTGQKDELGGDFLAHTDLALIKDSLQRDVIEKNIERVSTYLNNLPSDISQNQKLACFIFEEVIPKLFGTSLYSAMHHIRMRIPFIDNTFFSAIVKTEVSQFYRNFMETNPIKRFWGQYPYSKIIQRTWPEIGLEMSGKGYAPSDLLSLRGRIKVTKGYFQKEKRKKSATFDKLSLISGMRVFLKKHPEYEKMLNLDDETYENLNRKERMRDMVFLRLSQSVYENQKK